MKDKEIIEAYLNSLKQELLMYADGLSERNICYIKDLKQMYCDFENEMYSTNYGVKDNPNTDIDDKLLDAMDEYNGYLHYMEEYMKTNNKEALDRSHDELKHFFRVIV